MAYIQDGRVVETRSPYRISIVTDAIFGVLNFVYFYFISLLDEDARPSGVKDKYAGKRGGFGGDGGPPKPPSQMRKRPISGMKDVQRNAQAPCGAGG